MLKILFQPYPFTEKTLVRSIIQSVIEGLFVALFLILFEPFGISTFRESHKNIILINYGFITTACSLWLRLGLFKVFSTFFSDKNWTIVKEIFTVFLLISLITVGNYIYSVFIFNLSFGILHFAKMFIMVIIIGIFPTVFGVMLNYIIQLKKYNQNIEIPHQVANEQSLTAEKLIFVAENEKDKLIIEAKDFLYIESSDNYSTVYYQGGHQLQKQLIRSSLSRLENQTVHNAAIVRTHRSYLVNISRVIKISGNAQGYKLQLDRFELQIPVSRKYNFLVENLRII